MLQLSFHNVFNQAAAANIESWSFWQRASGCRLMANYVASNDSDVDLSTFTLKKQNQWAFSSYFDVLWWWF